MLSSPDVIPIHDVLPTALAGLLRNAPLTPEKVAFAWRLAVGPATARATTVDLRDGVLHVRGKDAAWCREIERSAAEIRHRLNTSLGASLIRFISVEMQ